MTNDEFAARAGQLLAACSPSQRATLAEAAANYGKSAGAEDRKSTVLAADAAERGMTFEERFPNAKRLLGN